VGAGIGEVCLFEGKGQKRMRVRVKGLDGVLRYGKNNSTLLESL